MRILKLVSLFMVLFFCVAAQKKKAPKKDTVITISTGFGDMIAILYDDTPLHKENFIKLTKEGFYDSTTFHRIIDGFMIQGGDPYSKDDNLQNDGTGGPGYTIPNEIAAGHKHVFGAIAAARRGGPSNPEMASSGSQFYIVENENGTSQLDGQYTVYGQVISGLEVINKIAIQEKNRRDRPVKDIVMTVTAKEVKRKTITKKYNYEYK